MMNKSMKDKLEALREKRIQACRENEVFLREFKINDKMSYLDERYKKGLSELKDLAARDAGVDVERLKGLSYTVQEVQDWDTERAGQTHNTSYDYGLRAWTSYSSLISSLKSNVGLKGKEGIRAISTATDANRKRVSKRRKFDDEQDYTFINIRNQKFNQKLERAYEVYTTNIREGLEQG